MITREWNFQDRLRTWVTECFGPKVANDRDIRNLRFFEEAIELVQAGGMSRYEAHAMVDVIFERPVGFAPQEVGGVMTTLAAWCLAFGIDLLHEAETELTRISHHETMEKIRKRQLDKFRPEPGDPPRGAFVLIDYTNYRGERSKRIIAPRYAYFGATEFHSERQWLLSAVDIDKGPRTFAIKDIHSWVPWVK